MRSLLQLLLLIVGLTFAMGVASCGDSRTGRDRVVVAAGASEYKQPVKDIEGDYDNLKGGYYDRDDEEILMFGHAATGAKRGALAMLVRRYHDAAAAADGVEACRLLNPVLAETVTEKYAEPHDGGHDTCGAVLTRYYRRNHESLAAEGSGEVVGGVRVDGDRGFVMLGLVGVKPRREMGVKMFRGVWKIDSVLDSTLP